MSGTWFPVAAPAATVDDADGPGARVGVLERVANLRPAYGEALRAVEAAVWGQDQVEPEVLELCRLRIAQMLGADPSLTAPPVGVAPDATLVAQLRQWPTADVFTERQRVALGFAEQLVVDAQGVNDEHAASVPERTATVAPSTNRVTPRPSTSSPSAGSSCTATPRAARSPCTAMASGTTASNTSSRARSRVLRC